MKLGDFRPALLSWLAVSFLAVACCVLAVLQHRWITDFSAAQRDRLHQDLQARLNLIARSFNDEISTAVSALLPPAHEIDPRAPQAAYAARYESWKQSNAPIFRRIALAARNNGDIALSALDLQTSEFQPAPWPNEWGSEYNRLLAPGNHEHLGSSLLIELPRFGPGHGPGRGPHEGPNPGDTWLLAELNPDYLNNTLLPELLNRYLGDNGKLNYDVEVVSLADPSFVIYQSAANHNRIGPAADASISLLDIRAGRDEGFPGRGGAPGFRGRPFFGPPGPQHEMMPGRWQLSVRHHAGSLEALVDQAQRRNVVVSAGLLLLILATIAALLRVSRQSQRLAESQMNFVAGVSHELRTPLTVIRTAAFNLRGKLAARPDQVEAYGKLIQRESERLTTLVEQVLRFASGEAGHVIREREPVSVEILIDLSVESARESLETRDVTLEIHMDAGLPLVLADRQAMQQALGNIVENALKYGTGDHRWIGVSAAVIVASSRSFVEIRVADRGPGIPAEERDHIFDPFFRGRRAVADQLHGTGLGLSLVKKIVEAHGGSVSVHSEPMHGAEFIVRLPTAPSELQHEFAHSLG